MNDIDVLTNDNPDDDEGVLAEGKAIGSKKAGGIPIPSGEEKAILKSLDSAEGLIRNNQDTETFVAFDEQGKGVFVRREKGSSVYVGDSIRQYPDLFLGATLTHNHPQSTPFSLQDVETACLANAAEIRIASKLCDYSLHATSGNFSMEMWKEKIKPAVARYDAELRKKYYDKLEYNQKTQTEDWEFERLYSDELWKRVADDLSSNVVYNKKDRPQKGAKK